MKTLILLLALTFPVAFTPACKTAPSERVVAVQTLKSVGQSAEAAVMVSLQMYKDGKITPAQTRAVLDFYDLKFQPTFRLAVSMVNADMTSIAHPEVLGLLNQLVALVASYTPMTPATSTGPSGR